jgi:hypothetical protein
MQKIRFVFFPRYIMKFYLKGRNAREENTYIVTTYIREKGKGNKKHEDFYLSTWLSFPKPSQRAQTI